jgi:hypothetical protein
MSTKITRLLLTLPMALVLALTLTGRGAPAQADTQGWQLFQHELTSEASADELVTFLGTLDASCAVAFQIVPPARFVVMYACP